MRFNKRHREICFYCGIRGNHRHHVDPRSASGKNYFYGVEYVYSCPECNNAISDNLFDFIHEEVEFLIRIYTKKYHLITHVKEWDEDEIKELGPNLKQIIRKKLALRRKNEDRVYYLQGVRNYLLNNLDFT